MADDRIDRVRADLEVVRQAAGLGLSFGREDIIMVLLAVAGAVALGFWSLIYRGPWLRTAAVMLLALTAGGQVWLRAKYRRGSGRPSIRRREYSVSIAAGSIVFLGLLSYFHFSRGSVERPAVYAAVMLSLALSAFLVGTFDRNRRRYLAGALMMLLAGIAIPVFYNGPVIFAVCAACAVGGLADAAIMAYELRKARAAV